MSVGRELSNARQRLGLSIEDVAARTKIKVERLKAIEEADLWNLPAHVYLKGFLREYASTVKLDPEDVTERYLAELDDWAALAETQPGAGLEPELGDAELDRAWNPDEGAKSFHRQEPDTPARLAAEFDDADEPFAVQRTRHVPFVPADAPAAQRVARLNGRTMGRWLLPVVGLLAIVIGYLVISPFFRASAPENAVAGADAGSEPTEEPVASDRANDAVDASATRGTTASPDRARNDSGQPADARETRGASSTPPAESPSKAPSPNTTPRAESPAAEGRSATSAPPLATPRAVPPSQPTSTEKPRPDASTRAAVPSSPPATGPGVPASVASGAPARPAPAEEKPVGSVVAPTAAAPANENEGERPSPASPRVTNVSGTWSLATRVEATDYAAFRNLNLGYRLQLRQSGDRVTGSGLKWMENGRAIPARSRTPIQVEGVLKGNRLELQFIERGAQRESGGTFVMTVEPDGTLTGRFESSAANSRGHSLARRTGR